MGFPAGTMDDLVWQILLAGFAIFVVFKISLITYRRRAFPEPPYNWGEIDTGDLSFPEGFIWGTANPSSPDRGQPKQ
ncbi:MAG: hypothetical protein Ct9H90mP1_1710 [Methanobacteriota archaeon]|nr:MAG: hypothetical protein Ct9H90mP1_1710 [Euryarchaeota archaeon]